MLMLTQPIRMSDIATLIARNKYFKARNFVYVSLDTLNVINLYKPTIRVVLPDIFPPS